MLTHAYFVAPRSMEFEVISWRSCLILSPAIVWFVLGTSIEHMNKDLESFDSLELSCFVRIMATLGPYGGDGNESVKINSILFASYIMR